MIPESIVKSARILVVDDDQAVARLLEQVLGKAGYQNIKSTTEPHAALGLFLEFQPDLVVLDLHMPKLDGFDMMERIGPHVPEESYLPILVLTGDLTPETRRQALAAGARDFLTKPVDHLEVLLRIYNLLEARFLYLELRQQNEFLEERVREQTREVEEAGIEILERLARAAEYRDDYTRRHTERVGIRAALLARALGLPEDAVRLIRRAAPLHDVGKIGVPDRILLKPGPLTPEEVELMRTHTIIGAQILSGSRFPLLQLAEEIALSHHEHWNGTGYPHGLEGGEIPLSARIVAVVDFFDALAHDRPYRRRWPTEDVTAEILHQSGQHFDPHVAEVFLSLLRREGCQTAVA